VLSKHKVPNIVSIRVLTALPVYNEEAHLLPVLDEVWRHASHLSDVLVVDDGSTDGTGSLLRSRPQIRVIRHQRNRGYGAALRTAFQHAIDQQYDIVVTIDCDGQHEPCRIPEFIAAAEHADIVSGSRYLKHFPGDSDPPPERRRINQLVTQALNERLGLQLTDAFCGFKAYRVEGLRQLHLTQDGYAMPIELWVQAVAAGLTILELPVPLIYLEEARSFGGALDDANYRLRHYFDVLERSLQAAGLESSPAGELSPSVRDCRYDG